MQKLEIFDASMCCSGGGCGAGVDPQLVQFAAVLQWAAGHGVDVERHNLREDPQAFFSRPEIVREMKAGLDHLPVLTLDGRIVMTGIYPSRGELAALLGIAMTDEEAAAQNSPATFRCTSKTGCC